MLDIELTKTEKQNKLISLEDAPFIVSVKRKNPESTSPAYRLTLYNSYYTLKSEQSSFRGNYNRPLIADGNFITITLPDPSVINEPDEYGLRLMGMRGAINKYASRVSVTPVPKAGLGMLEIADQDELAERAARIIDVLIYKYNQSNI